MQYKRQNVINWLRSSVHVYIISLVVGIRMVMCDRPHCVDVSSITEYHDSKPSKTVTTVYMYLKF